jgi:membrane fusion protein (multidrug efflux system)
MNIMSETSALRADARRPAAKTRDWAAIRRYTLRFLLIFALPLVVVLAGGWWYLTSGRYVSTDDSFVEADTVPISADVGGRVTEVLVKENDRVQREQVLFRLDDRPYRIAVEKAKASLANARMQIDALRASYQQKQADLLAAQDMVTWQQQDFERQKALLAQNYTPRAKFDEARHNFETARQSVVATQAQIANIVASLNGDPNIATDRHPLVQQAQAQLDQAQLDLSHTVIAAPEAGIVTLVSKLPPGTYLNAATPAFSLVATDHVWIEANFKETDLTHMQPGQSATVTVDSYPGVTFTAQVESLSPGTGSVFSVIPAQNATGNWVKVPQRLPVRLRIDNPDPTKPLRAGMSATAEIDTQHRSPFLVRIEGALGIAHAAETR